VALLLLPYATNAVKVIVIGGIAAGTALIFGAVSGAMGFSLFRRREAPVIPELCAQESTGEGAGPR
jgi:hypothetical protein